MKTSTRLVVGILAVIAAARPALAAEIDMCATVPVADVESSIGIKAAGTQKGVRECTWITAGASTVVSAGVSYVAKDAKIDKAGTAGYIQAMKQMGRTATVVDDTPTLWCVQISGSSQITECRTIVKGFELTVSAGGTSMTPAAKVKALVAKVSARLP